MSELYAVQAVVPRLPAGRWWRIAVAAPLGFACLAILFAVNPADSSVFPPCPFRALTGLYCPGCGTLRGLHQLLHGNVLEALDFNLLMVLALPFLCYLLVSTTVLEAGGRRLPAFQAPASWIWALLGVITLYWILRNVPAYPFSVLAP